MKTLIYLNIIFLYSLSFASGDIVYFFNAKAVKSLNSRIESLIKNEASYLKFIQEFNKSGYNYGKGTLSWSDFKKKAKVKEKDKYFEKITWYLLDTYSTQKISDSFHEYMIMFDFYYHETQTPEYRKLVKLADSKDDSVRKKALIDLIKYKNINYPNFNDLKSLDCMKKVNIPENIKEEAFLLYSMNSKDLREKHFSETFPTFIISSHDYLQGYLSHEDLQKIKKIGEGGYLDYVLEQIKLITKGSPYFTDKVYFEECIQKVQKRLDILKKLGRGSLIVNMFND